MKDRIREIVRKVLKEMSATGGEGYLAPFAFNPDKNADGASRNYYVKKLGFKLVNKNKLHNQAKGIESKPLWNKDKKNKKS
jgi:hypothetical protein